MEAVVFPLEKKLDCLQAATFIASDVTLGKVLHAAMRLGRFNRFESISWRANARNILVGALSTQFGSAKETATTESQVIRTRQTTANDAGICAAFVHNNVLSNSSNALPVTVVRAKDPPKRDDTDEKTDK
jgi:hypothetical protein